MYVWENYNFILNSGSTKNYSIPIVREINGHVPNEEKTSLKELQRRKREECSLDPLYLYPWM